MTFKRSVNILNTSFFFYLNFYSVVVIMDDTFLSFLSVVGSFLKRLLMLALNSDVISFNSSSVKKIVLLEKPKDVVILAMAPS